MKQDKNTEEFYERLKKQLEEYTTWPAPYLYKFIVPAVNEKIAEIRSIFDDVNAEIITRDSTKGNYTSVSIRVTLDSPEQVVKIYIEVSSVEGVISL